MNDMIRYWTLKAVWDKHLNIVEDNMKIKSYTESWSGVIRMWGKNGRKTEQDHGEGEKI